MPRLGRGSAKGSPLGKALAACVLALAFAAMAASCASAPPSPLAQEWYELGNSWLDKKEWKKAGEAYSHALAIDPSLAGASYNLARALAEAGDYEGSLRALDGLAKRDPGNVRVAAARAYALYKKGDAAEALKAYRAVLALDPYAPDAVYNVALLELATGDTVSAAADLDALSVAAPDDGQVLLALGRARDKNGDAAAALAAYEKAKALGKVDAQALERMGELYGASKRYPEAMDAFASAVKADPKRAGAWFSLARLRLVVASDAEQGLAALKAALDAGFSDRKAALALLDEPDLPEREKVLALLKAKGLSE
jgi:tetratricopeptide (TPR) repeat protein